MNHTPIMVNEILTFMKEMPGGVSSYMDGTFGRGGHLRAVLNAFPNCRALALDKDLQAIEHAHTKFKSDIEAGRVQILHADYTSIRELVDSGKTNLSQFDAVLLDLGVSSPQLDSAERGFSFIHEGPLDMRMNQTQPLKASDVVNTWSEEDLKKLFIEYGEVQSPGRVVRAIINDRKEKPFLTTPQLAGLIERVEGWKKKGFHPATQYFMALRIQVNNELENLEQALKDIMELLRLEGRLLVITFHSLEDRIVKQVFANSLDKGFAVNKRVIIPSDEEQKNNPRSRSAKLRVFERSDSARDRIGKKDKYADKKGQ